MDKNLAHEIDEGIKAAAAVLRHNAHGRFHGLPRTAGWGYPEPYTRDLMIAVPGILLSGDKKLIETMRRVFETLAANQSRRGHIPSLVHDSENRGASDTTPLFILALAFFRQAVGEENFLDKAMKKALTWMSYQSPCDLVLVAQLPTSDWRDEQWVLGYGLFVNTIVYSYLRFLSFQRDADILKHAMTRFTITGGFQHRHVHEGFTLKLKPYFSMWSYKIYSSERFDLLGNSLAILSGLASQSRSLEMIAWIEAECESLRRKGDLSSDMVLPPNFFPYILEHDPDWRKRYKEFNQPGHYHNGGIWPFICGFYVAALVAAGKLRLAEKKMSALTRLVRQWHTKRKTNWDYGFNEWFRAQDGTPMGQDWQTWSAAMYIYAAVCVREKRTPFFDIIRQSSPGL